LLVIALAFAGTTAHAQPSDRDVAAESLFREGRRLVKDGKLAEGCDKLEASERMADSVGTLLNLGDCREKTGQLATAWAMFLRAATAARAGGDATRETEARTRAHALEPRLSYLTISVPRQSEVDGLAIERDGAAVDPALWNQGVPIDAGAYEIRGRAPGHEPWSTRVEVQNGQKVSVEVPRFKQIRAMTAAVAPAAPLDAQPEPAAAASPPPPRHRLLSPLRDAALASAAVGLAGITVGVKLELDAKDLQRQADAICPATMCDDRRALSLNSSARHDAQVGDIVLGVAGAAVAAGAAMWLVGAPHISASVGSDRVSIALSGRF
jgi:hypothetical protein